MVALLETIMTSHKRLKDEFEFDDFLEVLAIGRSEGLVLLWNTALVTVSRLKKSDQEAKLKTIQTIHRVLFAFCTLSGEKINSSKSKALYSKACSDATRNLILQLLNITHATNFGKYLGFPILNKNPKPFNFLHIINNVKAKLSNWKMNFLSQAGRLTLINSTLAAIPAYTMQYFILPKRICKDIDKIQRNFLWGSTTLKRKLHYINWDTVTLPKHKGGLGLSKAQDKNLFIVASLSWRLLTNPHSMLARTLINKYGSRSSTSSTSFI
ncbi:hypothetical protein H5410_010449 [Solanum commersonii]|uniref:Uncharacterized protein n=1 Tax=Solanum commersonii TaxID=4109 RepID=A0A9J6AMG1_SOLCO|nr:hypothetical protein H5410_010449 [Solanum commersonii]